MRDPVRALDGLLSHPDLYPLQSDRHHIVGLLLAQSGCDPRQGRPRGHHCAHHDHPHGVDERGVAKNLLRQVDRRLPGRVLLHGVRFVIG